MSLQKQIAVFENSLLKFNNPVKIDNNNMTLAENNATDNLTTEEDEIALREVFHAIKADREWTVTTSDGKEENWKQSLSKAPAGADDVTNLARQLDQLLIEKKARANVKDQTTNICPIREDIYNDCFDELCRQVAVENVEQGKLLTRLRDEMRLTLDAHKTLYYNSLLLNMKKEISHKQITDETNIESQCSLLVSQNLELENEISELRTVLENIEKNDTERRNNDEKKHKEEIDYLRYQHQQSDQFLKQLNAMNLNK